MRILMVAPDMALEHAPIEVQDVNNALHPDLLMGVQATPDNLMRRLMTGRYELLWFAGHGTETGIIMSGGEELSTADLSQMLRSSRPQIFLNTCESVSVASQIHTALGTGIVATIGEVDDELAYRTGVMFANALEKTGDIAEAYRAARPDSGQFVYFNGTLSLSRKDRRDETLLEIIKLRQRIEELDANLQASREEFCNYLKQIQASIDDRFADERRRADAKYLLQANRVSPVLLGIGAGFFLIGILLTLPSVAGWHGLRSNVQAGLIVLFLILSAYFLITGFGIGPEKESEDE